MKKISVLVLILSLAVTGLWSTGWAVDNSFGPNDPEFHLWSIMDLVFARPLGVVAAVAGAGIFVVGLPFTVTVDLVARKSDSPTGAVSGSAKMLMLKPLQFSFVRQFPDDDI